jgi:hypothetical protein
MAAHIARDEDQGGTGRTVRDFISELRGLARSGKQKLVLAETETASVALATFFEGGRGAIAKLLNLCKEHTKPVKPEDLGLIGADHLLEDCCKLGVAEESFMYKRQLGTTRAGLPYAIEGPDHRQWTGEHCSGEANPLTPTSKFSGVAANCPSANRHSGSRLDQ